MKEHLYNYILRNQGDESLVLVSEILAMDCQSPYYYSRDKDMPVNSKYVNLLALRVHVRVFNLFILKSKILR